VIRPGLGVNLNEKEGKGKRGTIVALCGARSDSFRKKGGEGEKEG